MDKSKEVEDWIKIAEEDLQAAKFLKKMEPTPLEIICFHCQQSAEKYLKAFLVKNNIVIKKTHDLEILLKKCIEVNDDLINLKKSAIRLTDYAVKLRYPYRFDINNKIMEIAIKDAENIKKTIKKLI